MREDIQPGNLFPNYELIGHDRQQHKLSDLQGINPLIVILSRGYYCPKDQWQHKRLVEFYPELKVGYAGIVTISTDRLLETREFRTSLNAPWTFLSDPDRAIQKDLDIQEYTDPHHDPMIPYTIVLKPNLEIYKVYNGYWFFNRPTVEDLRQDLREINRQIRPDLDITKPHLRMEWEAGDRKNFYPYSTSAK